MSERNVAAATSMHRRASVAEPVSGNDVEPLLAACRSVGAALGIAIMAPAVTSEGAAPRDRLADIARASGLWTRNVLLRGAWWRGEHGPLLAFREVDRAPLALLPRGGARYVLVDPRSAGAVRVTAEVASELSAVAVMFYRPLPARPLVARDIVRFGLWGGRADLRTALGVGVVRSLVALALPIVAGLTLDALVAGGPVPSMWVLGGVVVAAALAAFALDLAQRMAVLRVTQRLGAALDAAVWDRLLSLPVGALRGYGSGELAALAGSAGSLAQLLVRGALNVAVALAGALAGVGVIGWFAPRLLGVALATLPAVTVGALLLARLQQRSARLANARRGDVAALVLEAIGGIVRVRVSGAERRVLQRWQAASAAARAAAYRAGVAAAALVLWDAVTPLLAVAALLGVATRSLPSLSSGALVAALLGLALLIAATAAIASETALVLRSWPALRQVVALLRAAPENAAQRAHPGALAGAIEVRDVSFRYAVGGPLILDRVSLSAQPGEFVAIVGASGSGKSTLLRLLLGFEQPDAGVVAFDGQDLAGLDLREVRQQLGVVLQHGSLMVDDLLHNIVGATTLSLEDAWAAARLAGLADEIAALPMGMHTMVPEGGSTFSGGQRQRLLIARALVRKPRILLFDEATSALDNAAQATVSASLEQLAVTRIVIAHRLSTIRNADRIYVLDGGQVAESGTYAELLAADGLFAQLASRQLM